MVIGLKYGKAAVGDDAPPPQNRIWPWIVGGVAVAGVVGGLAWHYRDELGLTKLIGADEEPEEDEE